MTLKHSTIYLNRDGIYNNTKKIIIYTYYINMKIIRLTTQDPLCVWDNFFNDELTIKKDSKIALHNISVELDLDEFTIDAQNNLLQFDLNFAGTAQNTLRQVELEQGIYSRDNIGELFDDLTVKCNSSMGIDGSELGKEWDITLGKTSKIDFQCNSGDYIKGEDPVAQAKYFQFQNCAINGGLLQRTGGTVGSGDSNLFFKTAIGLGSSVFRIKLNTTTVNNSTSGIFMGLTDTFKPSTTMTSDFVKYGIRILKTGQLYYRYTVNGEENESQPLLEAKVGDDVYIQISREGVKGIVNDGTTIHTLFTEPYDHQSYLYPFISMYGASTDTTINANTIRLTSSYSYNKINNLQPVNSLEAFPSPFGFGTRQKIVFPNVDLATFLGFTKLEENSFVQPTNAPINKQGQKGAVLNAIWTGDKNLNYLDNAPSYIVELQNLPLEFYDGQSNGLKNYLYAFPNSEGTIIQRLNYSTSYPVFLDIKSINDISLKNIKARLIHEDGTTVNVKGLSTLTLLIQ